MVRRAAAEFAGTAFLLAAIVGSGIMAERLAGGNVALALLANSLATGAALVALIAAFGPVSGAHFNPAVSLAMALRGATTAGELMVYVAVQIAGAYAGVAMAHAMFGCPLFAASAHARAGAAQMLSEFIATFGLVTVISVLGKERASATPYAVAGYIVAAYWFTASTSFANPAVTLARAVTNSFTGIRPADAPGFIAAQCAGAVAAARFARWLYPAKAFPAHAAEME